MADISELKSRAQRAVLRERDRYTNGAQQPIGGYLATMAAYGFVVAAGVATARLTRRQLPGTVAPWDLVLLSLATHKLSRIITKDSVTSPLRVPFTRYEGPGAPAELTEQVRGHGIRHAVGELVTCPFCMGMWVATGFTAGLVFVPRATRLAAGTLAVLDLADLLQFGYAAVEQATE